MASEENVCDVASLREPFRTLISAAILAPSGDNTQPWRFEIDDEMPSITVCVDETRDTSPMNAGQRMARIACGAAVENIVQTAAWNRWSTTVEHVEPSAVRVILDGDCRHSGDIPEAIKNRHTNRKLYNGQPISASQLRLLEESIDVPEGIEVRFITERRDIERCADLIGQADAIMFGQIRFLQAFLDNVRFDQPTNAPVEFGLSIGSLELKWLERQLLPHMRQLPEAVTSSLAVRRAFKAKARQLVQSAGGLCVICARPATDESDLEIGRIMEQAWLAFTRFGFAVQPMMSIPVLASAGRPIESVRTELVRAMQADPADNELLAAILRFGYGPPSTARTGRHRPTGIAISNSINSKPPGSDIKSDPGEFVCRALSQNDCKTFT